MVDVLVIPDGAGAISLGAARMPALGRLAEQGATALIRTTPAGLTAGSEVCIPALLGHPPEKQPGRGRVDAAAYGIEVPSGLTPWRADAIRPDRIRATVAEAAAMARRVDAIHTRGHRLLLLAPGRPPAHPQLRIWDDGPPPRGPLDRPTAIVCGPGAAAGCGRLLGAHVIIPAGATGDVDADLGAKRRAATAAITEGWARVVVHVGAPDEAAHRRDPHAVAQALERIDAELIAPLATAVRAAQGRLAVCADHATDPFTGAHGDEPVRAVRWGAGIESAPTPLEPQTPQWLWQPQAVPA